MALVWGKGAEREAYHEEAREDIVCVIVFRTLH